MRFAYYFCFLILIACGVKPRSVDYGRSTSGDLIVEKGEPLKISVPSKNINIYQYPRNQKFQMSHDIVTHGFRDPVGDERTLLYWKHKFKECKTETIKLPHSQGHELPEYELKCSMQGLTVIYSESSEFISRVIEHEKK